MVKIHDLLGMNARNLTYLRLNKVKGRRIADSKLLTKRVLRKYKVPHPRLVKLMTNSTQVQQFDWLSLKKGFVIKPSDGWGGEGILVIKKASKFAGEWIEMNGRKIYVEDLKLHALDILEGRYSRNKAPDRVIIEERVKIHPKFRKYARGGTPDVRVIVFNSIPVMAMLRLPTRESNGKANLHQGAVGLGLDMATGITTHGILHYQKTITHIPETNKKVNGLRVPFWEDLLKIAVDAQRASGLGFVGVDLLIDEDDGPLVVELNDQPGLQIQMANQQGLLKRLRRIDDLELISPYKGIQIAQILFAERFADKVKSKDGRKILGIFEKVKIKVNKHKRYEVVAKIDTGAYSVSIDYDLAKELGLLEPQHVLWEKKVRSSLGVEKRPIIQIEFWLQGKKVTALAHVSKRKHLRAQMLIGRKYIREFLIDPGIVKNF
ncbi:alpha-L-glutamate ligase-like protein [Candidatus Beckwithbacteria bacterium]|nr:alpha-L-glutamate ligase-like protein [Candidatus Beckwithbacteria bacterium]